MKIDLIEDDIEKWRGDIVGLFAGIDQPEFGNVFDWYYRPAGRKPAVWILATDEGETMGTCSVVFREMKVGSRKILGGVSGNLVVDARHRNMFAATTLMRATQKLVTDGVCDVLLGLPLPSAFRLAKRAGFNEIGKLKTHSHVWRSASLLKPRVGPLGALGAPLVDGFFKLKRSGGGTVNVSVERLAPDSLSRYIGHDWQPSRNWISCVGNSDFVRWRFFENPAEEICAFGLRVGEQPHGYVIVNVEERQSAGVVVACETDPGTLSAADAIMAVLTDPSNQFESMAVPTLQNSQLARQLLSAGFVTRKGRYAEADTVLALWNKDHELASVFESKSNWALFPGFNDV